MAPPGEVPHPFGLKRRVKPRAKPFPRCLASSIAVSLLFFATAIWRYRSSVAASSRSRDLFDDYVEQTNYAASSGETVPANSGADTSPSPSALPMDVSVHTLAAFTGDDGAAYRNHQQSQRPLPQLGSKCEIHVGNRQLSLERALDCRWHAAPGATTTMRAGMPGQEGIGDGVQVQCCCALDASKSPRFRANAAASSNPDDNSNSRPPPFTCFPSLVIAGSQKSGTTALFSYLLFHDAVIPARRKEVHFFDRFQRNGPNWYLSRFPEWPTPTPSPAATTANDDNSARSSLEAFVSSHIGMEATPSYMLGTATAAGLHRLLPHGKVVVILRDPVSRAWSEYNMKRRRVDSQVRHDKPEGVATIAGWLTDAAASALVSQAARDAIRSLLDAQTTHSVRDEVITRLKQALVDGFNLAVFSSGAHPQLKLNFRRPVASAVCECIAASVAEKAVEAMASGPQAWLQLIDDATTDGNANGAVRLLVQPLVSQGELSSCINKQDTSSVRYESVGDWPDVVRTEIDKIRSCSVKVRGRGKRRQQGDRPMTSSSDSAFTAEGPLLLPPPLIAQAEVGGPEQKQWPHDARSGVRRGPLGRLSLLLSARRRIEKLRDRGMLSASAAAEALQAIERESLGVAGSVSDTSLVLAGEIGSGSIFTDPGGPVAVIRDGGSVCYPRGATSNIDSDFLYRSLYLTQLQRLDGMYGAENVLVLLDDDLRSHTQAVLDVVTDFVGIERLPIDPLGAEPSFRNVDDATGGHNSLGRRLSGRSLLAPNQTISEAVVKARFDALYPSFEKVTGWRMKGDYGPMDAALERQLVAFFAPYNAALYRYLGADLGWKR